MYDGTLATRGPWQALVTFQQLLILADQHGQVDMTPDAISRRTTIPLAIIEAGIAELEKPDDGSRTPDEEGRRIIRVSDNRTWGWIIVNYAKYRAMRSAEERREYMRQYQRKRRADPTKAKPKRANCKRPISDDWLPSEKTIARLGAEFKLSQTQIQQYFDHFVAACKSKDYRYKDFDAAFSNSVRADWPRLRENEKPAGNLKGGPMPTPARPCDYCGAKSIGTVNGFSHCRAHSDSALFHEKPTSPTQ